MRLGDAIKHLALDRVARVDGEDAAIRKGEQGRAVVVVLLEVRIEDDVVGLATIDVVDRDLDVAPIRIVASRVKIFDRPHRTDNQLAVGNDRPFVHEPRPSAVVVERDQFAGDEICRAVGMDSCNEDG